MKNSADLGGCYPQRPKAEVDNTLLDLQNSSYPTQPNVVLVEAFFRGSFLKKCLARYSWTFMIIYVFVNVSRAVLCVGKVVSMLACVYFFLAVWLKLPP